MSALGWNKLVDGYADVDDSEVSPTDVVSSTSIFTVS
jgi:hypothetical protein